MEISDNRTTNVQLQKYASKFNIKVNILMNDQFKVPKNGYYILNLENSSLSGSHWVALICTSTKCFYFDSYGAPPTNRVHQRLKLKYDRIYMNNQIIQSLNSEMCGWFALGLILYVHLHPKQELLKACDAYLNMFDDNTERNNKILKNYFHSL